MPTPLITTALAAPVRIQVRYAMHAALFTLPVGLLGYPSNKVRTANPVSVRARVMVSASLSAAAVPVSKR